MPRGFGLILALYLFSVPLKAQLIINEIQVSNISTKLDPDVNYRQWIEIYNAGSHGLDLYGYFISDELADPQKFRINENIYVAAKNHAIIWLDPDDNYYGGLKLDMDGGELCITKSSGYLMDQISYPEQYIDISFGRETDGAADWCYFRDPTPDLTNNTRAYPLALFPDSLFFSLPGGFYSGSQILSLSGATVAGEIRYTTDGSWPTESSRLYSSPLSIHSSMVIRARIFEDDKLPGDVKTNTYFLNEESSIPIVSISTDPENFFSGGMGIYVEGYRGITGLCSEIPVNWNRDWERPINIEYYTTDGNQVINQMAGTKIFGGCSRTASFKSLALYARKRYGDNSFSHPFFSSKPVDEFKGLVLRNSGNDAIYSLLRDGFMQSLVMGKMDVDYLGYQPANVFVNGEYFGILNVREKINEHYVSSNYGIEADQIDMLEKEAFFDWGKVISGEGYLYAELIDYVDQHDLSEEANYSHVSTLMDVEEFLNYYLAEIYFENEDWPQNNIKYWRYHGEGGKWRWILFDTDFGWGLFPNSGNSLQWATRGASDDKLIRALLENEKFKYEFIQRMAGFMNTIFHPDTAIAVLDSIAAIIAPEIPRHAQRWGRPDVNQFEYQTLNKMPRFANTRPDSVRKYMKYKFGIAGLNTLSASVDDPNKGFVQAAGVKLPDQFSGLYFRDVPVRMHAVPLPGYSFSHWQGSSESSSPTIYLDLKSDQAIEAVFEVASPLENVFINEVSASNSNSVSDEYDQFNDWLEIYNGNDFEVDLAGYFLSDTIGNLVKYQFPDGLSEQTTIGAGEYQLIWCDAQPTQGALHTNFKLSKEGETLFLVQLLADEFNIIDSVKYTDQYSDITFGRNPDVDRWDFLLPTPGEKNSLRSPVSLQINEFLSSNDGSFSDEFHEYDDWIELYNPSNDTVDIAGLFLTDSLQNPLKHQIPMGELSTLIPPLSFLVLWADGQEEQGALHLGFKLDGKSEQIGLYQVGSGIIDSLSYDKEFADVSIGRYPDGSDTMIYLTASAGTENGIKPRHGLFINEFLAGNQGTFSDEYGEFDDWIEIYNANDYPVDLGGLYLSDSLNDPAKYRIPLDKADSTVVPAQGYLILWADGQEEQGVLHLGFKLDRQVEQIGIFQVEEGFLDSLSYTSSFTDISTGRFPDASTNIQIVDASPGWENDFIRKDGLYINEFISSNISSGSDEYGEFDDWIEIYNGNNYPVDLGGLYLSDSLDDPMKHRIPISDPDSTTIPAFGHLLFWADGQKEQGIRHLDFKLDGKSEQISLYQPGGAYIDSLTYLVDFPDVPNGRLPDGLGEIQYLSASPGSENFVRQLEGIYINEFMPRNVTTEKDEFGEFDDWIELYNSNDFPVDLGGAFITDSLGNLTKYRFPTGVPDSTSIQANDYLLLWADNQNAQGVLHLNFSLSGDGEQIGLVQADGKQIIDSLTYATLQDDQALGILEEEMGNYKYVTATPGWINFLEPSEKLYISEIVASGNELYADEYGEYDDWIEIYNDNDFSVDVGGLYLSDSLEHLPKFRIPSNAPDSTTIEAGGYLIFWADNQPEQGFRHLGFRLKGEGEYLVLSGAGGAEILDSVNFPNQYKHFSYSREDDLGVWKFFPPTGGEANIAPVLNGLYINEFMASSTSFTDENGECEDWIEIFNANSFDVDVGGLYLTDSIDDPTKYRIPSHSPEITKIKAGSYVILYADDQKDQGIFHTNFRLKRGGEQIALFNYDERTVIDSLSYPEQYSNASCSFFREDGSWRFLPPTPGRDNVCPDVSNLVINEVMGYNRSVVDDDHGEYENWIELYNKGETPIDIGGLFFTDSLGRPDKFRIPSDYPDSTTIGPHDYLTLWADNTSKQGILHLGFGIAKTGEELGIFNHMGQLVDSIFYPFISPDVSWGRIPDGNVTWAQLIEPTPSGSNILTMLTDGGMEKNGIKIYPNPVKESAIFEIPLDDAGKIRIEIIDANGALISIIQAMGSGQGLETIHWDVKDAGGADLSPGIYVYRVLSGARIYSGRFIVH